MEKVIFSDFFGVIVDEISPFWLEEHFPGGEGKKLKEEIVNKGDTGEYSEKEVFEKLSALSGVEASSIRNQWLESATLNQEMVDLILRLKENHKVYLLSNAMTDFIEVILKRFDLCRLFDKMYISAAVGHAKPDADYFEYVLNDLSLNPEDCIFIDDNIKNIMGAEKVKISTIHYKNISVDDVFKKIRETEE